MTCTVPGADLRAALVLLFLTSGACAPDRMWAWLTEEQRDPWAWLCLVDRRGRQVDEGTWMTEAPKVMISTGDRQGFVAVEGAER